MITPMLRLASIVFAVFFMTGYVAEAQSVQWELLPGPYAGTVRAFAFADDGSLLAGTEGGGIFRSTDDGRTWKGGHQGNEIRIVRPLTIGPDGRVFAGNPNNEDRDGVMWYSEDHGETWLPHTSGAGGYFNSGCAGIVTEPGGLMFAAGGTGGMRISADSGKQWGKDLRFPQTISIQHFTTRQMILDSTGAVLVFGWRSGRNKLIRTTDQGETWMEEEWFGGGNVVTGASGNLFGSGLSSVIRTSVDGVSRDTLSYGITLPENTVSVFDVDAAGALLAGAGRTLLRSTDDGESWSVVAELIGATSITALKAGENGLIVVGLSGAGVYRSTDDGQTWEHSMTGMNAADPAAMTVDPQGRILAAVDYAGLFRSGDGGVTWEELPGMDPALPFYSFTVTPAGTIIVTRNAFEEGVERSIRSTDDGQTWEDAPEMERFPVEYVTPEPGVLLVGTLLNGILRSTDDGVTWEEAVIEPPSEDNTILDMASVPDGIVYAVASRDRKVVLRSSDGGRTWSERDKTFSASSTSTNAWHMIGTPGGDVILNYPGDFLRSTDGGESWQVLLWNSGNRFRSVGSIAVTTGDRLFAIAAVGSGNIFHRLAGEETWKFSDSGLQTRDRKRLVADSSDGVLLSTKGGGIYYYSPTVSSVPVTGNRPDFHLSVVPSPVTGRTRVAFTMPNAGMVRLDVIDMRGGVVLRILEEELEAGSHQQYWEPGGLPSGAYMVRLRSGDEMTMIPVQVLR